jgi:hypothetical protein
VENGAPSFSKTISFKDAVINKPTTLATLNPPPTSLYITEKLEEVPVLEVLEKYVTNLLSLYESHGVICRFNGL